MAATRGRGLALNWQAKHGPVWGALNIALGLWAAASVAEHISLGALQMVWVGIGVIAVAMLTAFALLLTGRSVFKSFGTGLLILAGGAWVLVGRVNPRAPGTLGVLLVATICAAILAAASHSRKAKEAAARAAQQLAQAAKGEAARLAAEWERRIARVCKVEGRVRRYQMWPTKAGFTLTFLPAEGGTTVADLAAHAARLAADARLPNGCGVEVLAGEHRGEVVLQVSTVNKLAQEQPYPGDLSPRSIYQPIELGVRRDGTPSSIALRFASAVMAGQKGSGKTNRLHVLTAQLARCTDVLVWHIDLTGGLSLPWVQPWLEGRATAPGVDWVATTVDEAQLMVDAALAITRGRKPAYRARMRKANDDKVPIAADVPAIVLIIDEFASLPRNIQNAIIKISDEGRAPGVQTVSCALRGTADYLPRELLVQAANRISMRGTDEAEHAYVMGWTARMDPNEAPYEGCGFVKSVEDYNGSPRPDRAYRITPAAVETVVIETAKYRPQLDEVSVNMAEAVSEGAYRQRWDRYRDEAERIQREGHEALLEQIREHNSKRPPKVNVSAVEHLADPAKWPTPNPANYQRSDAHNRMLELLREASPNGLQPGALHARLTEEGFTTERQTVHKWLALEMSRGTVRQPVERGPYYATELLEASATEGQPNG